MSCRVRSSTRSGFDFRDCKSTTIASHIWAPLPARLTGPSVGELLSAHFLWRQHAMAYMRGSREILSRRFPVTSRAPPAHVVSGTRFPKSGTRTSYDSHQHFAKGSRPRCGSVRCGWCWSTAQSTRRNGRRSRRSRPKSAAQRRPCRNWVRQAERDQGRRPGVSTDERERIKALERENRELRQANEILRKASAYFAQAELDRRWKP